MDRGINLETKNNDGETALSLALDVDNIKFLESLLLRLCKSWNELPKSMIERFRTMIDEGCVIVLTVEIMHLIMINAPHLLLNACIDGINLFQYANKKGNIAVVNMMLRSQKMGTILNKIAPVTGCTPLYEAVMFGNVEIVEALMAAGADIRQTNSNSDKLFEVAVDEEIRYISQHYKNGYNTLLWEALNNGTEMDIYNLLFRKMNLMFTNEKGECFFYQMAQKVSTGLLVFALRTCEFSFNVKDKTTGKSARQYLKELGEETRLGIMKKYL